MSKNYVIGFPKNWRKKRTKKGFRRLLGKKS